MTIRTVYLAGPMTGVESFNFPAFDAAADALREAGLTVFSPADIDRAQGFNPETDEALSHSDYMTRDLPYVCQSDAVVVLSGWEDSRGAAIETGVARALGKPILAYPSMDRVDFLAPSYFPANAPEKSQEAIAAVPGGDGRERVTDPETGGMKERRAARFDLLPWDALWQVAELYGHGATKYDDHNWRKGYQWSLTIGALGRHLAKFAAGEDIDPDSGLPHPTCIAFHALTLLTFMREQPEKDDRAKATVTPWSS